MKPSAGTLADFSLGSRVILDVPHLDEVRVRQLAELGLRPGSEVLLLHRTAGGGRVVAVEDTRIALDRRTLGSLPAHRSVDSRSGGPA